MKKFANKSISFLLALIMLVSCFSINAFAAAGSKTIDKVEYSYIFVDGKLCVTSIFMKNKKTSLTIPSKIAGKNVEILGSPEMYASLWDSYDALKTITIPDSVKSINCLVGYADKLSTVNIGKNVAVINDDAFAFCPAITNFKVNKANKSFVADKGNLYNKTKTRLVKYAAGNKAKSFTLPKSVKSIAYGAFSNADNLTKITLNSKITKIPSDAFYSCDNLASVTIPANITSVGSNAFCGTKIKSVTLPKTVTSIGYSAFSYCEKLASIDVSATKIKKIEHSAFERTAITSFKFPSTVTSIDYGAFADTKLQSVTIPKTVTSMSDTVFYGCTKLQSVDLSKTKLTTLPGATFTECSKLTSVKLPSTLTRINRTAFGRCTSLETINIPKGVTAIEELAFLGCKSLKDFTLPSGLKKVSYRTFYGCVSIDSIVIPASVKVIDEDAFGDCNLAEITILGANTKINDYAFNDTDVSKLTIKALAGSPAEKFAANNEIVFQAL